MEEAPRQIAITYAYSLDMANFLSIMTGDEFYVSRHPEAHALWSTRLSEGAKQAIASAVAINDGSAMLGPQICSIISAIPGFHEADLATLLTRPDQEYEAWPYYTPEKWVQAKEMLQALLPAVRDLEDLGFHTYWTTERLPLIKSGIEVMHQSLSTLSINIGHAAASMLGSSQFNPDDQLELYMCTFASPHGIRITGRRFISDVQFTPAVTTRVGIHEMFHPPYELADVEVEAAALIADPLFQTSFQTKDPKFGYATETGFLEENIVEALELFVSQRAGLMQDPIEYLLRHDEGSHTLSVVLLKYFHQVPKAEDETFTTYLKRLVPAMPVGNLTADYNAEVDAWKASQSDTPA